jgi:NAD(P)-dependent dehydrogenase (short-subunit alcohol dehydrogenase family)
MIPALLVLGATGKVGRGVVAAAVAAGRPVIAVARETRELQALRAQFPQADLAIVRGSVADDARSARLVQALRRLQRPIDALVASICGECERGRVLDHPTDALRRMLDQNLLAHANAARHLLPLLGEGGRGGSYVLIGGPGGEQPWSGYGHRSIIAAALRMLARVLHEEARALSVRVQLLAVDSPLCTDANRAHACPQWPTAEAVGRRALELVDTRGPQPARAIVRYATPTSSAPEHSLSASTSSAPTPGEVRALIDTLVSSSRLKEPSP